MKLLLPMLVVIGTLCGGVAHGASDSHQRAAELDEAVDEVLAMPAYQWRMPRQIRPTEPDQEQGWFASVMDRNARALGRAVRRAASGVGRVIEWIGERVFRFLPEVDTSVRPDRWAGSLPAVYTVIIVLIAGMLVWLIMRGLRRRKETPTEIAAATPAVDLEDERVTADRLPASEWLALAEKLEGEGNLRHALRALFLAALAYLGKQGRVRLAAYKSNRDYARELEQRAQESVHEAFIRHTRLVEQAWYGDHPVGPEDVRRGQGCLQRIMTDAT